MTSLLVPVKRPQAQTGELLQLLVSYRVVISHTEALINVLRFYIHFATLFSQCQ